MTNKILVTGANGQLGNEFRKLSRNYPQFDFLFTDVVELNICDRAACIAYVAAHRPLFVVNCAAYTAVDKAEEEKEKSWMLNVSAVENLRDACAGQGVHFIHISTDYVFDGRNYKPYTEEDSVCPQSEYGRSKAAGEQAALAYDKSIVVRTAWLYSEFGINFMKTMLKLGAERPLLKVVFDQIGTPTLAMDLANALLQIIQKVVSGEKAFVPGVFHFSNEGVCSWYDFATTIMQLKGLACKVLPIEGKDYPTLAQRPHYSVLNKAKIKATYDIEIPYWVDSLKATIQTATCT